MLGKRNIPSWAPVLKLVGVCGRCHKYGCGPIRWLSYGREYVRIGEEQWEGIRCPPLVVLWGHSCFLLESTVLPSVVMLTSQGYCFGLSNFDENMIKLHIRSCFLTTSTKASQAVGVQIFCIHLRPSCHYLKILQSVKSCVSLWAKADPPFSSRSNGSLKLVGVKTCIC